MFPAENRHTFLRERLRLAVNRRGGVSEELVVGDTAWGRAATFPERAGRTTAEGKSSRAGPRPPPPREGASFCNLAGCWMPGVHMEREKVIGQ